MVQVSQLAGYVSEHSAYHHGDVSLTSTIVGMAQNFVGSNNVNLLYPSGLPLPYQTLLTIVTGKLCAHTTHTFNAPTSVKVDHPQRLHDECTYTLQVSLAPGYREARIVPVRDTSLRA